MQLPLIAIYTIYAILLVTMESSPNQPELVVYDVDGTMIKDVPGQSTGAAFWRLRDMGLLTPEDTTLEELTTLHELMSEAAEDQPWLHEEYSRLIVDEFDTRIGGLSETAIRRVFKEQAYQASQQIYPEMLDEIAYWKDRGATQVLISGSPDPFVQALRDRLGLTWATGTRLFYRQGKVDHLRLPSPRSSEKHLIAEKMRLRLSHELGKQAVFAAGYGDTMNDYSMLAASQAPVAVNPKPDLLQKAQQHNWRVITPATIMSQVA